LKDEAESFNKARMNAAPNAAKASRAGKFVAQPGGFRAFMPAPLPPNPPLEIGSDLSRVLSAADLALGRLDGSTSILPNPNLFVAMYVRREAVLSSQIEGTQASLTDVLEFEAGDHQGQGVRDASEVVNYIRALNFGLERVNELPLSLRLLKEIHAELMRDARGKDRDPGEFRRIQNWIGPSGVRSPVGASFVPPPPHELMRVLGELETFLHDSTLPPLIHAGLAHAQFETIHPFLDGNGRMGRLLITFLLCRNGVLGRPLLYLSHYFKRHRAQYYDRLQAIRVDGDWEGWLEFFLTGVQDVAAEAAERARQIIALSERTKKLLASQGKASGNLIRTLDFLFPQPIVTVNSLSRGIGVSFPTASGIASKLVKLEVLTEETGLQRNRRFRFGPYLDLFADEADVESGATSPDRTRT
jgi:Fic family protein